MSNLLRNRFFRLLFGILILTFVFVLINHLTQRQDNQPQAGLAAIQEQVYRPEEFQLASPSRTLRFPEDHGPHPDYQTEWWYYTGNLETGEGRHFGYQLTFFRRALTPSADRQARSSNWATDQIYMAHFALTDVAAGEHQAFERFSRGAAGLAGAQSDPFQVWLLNWQVSEVQLGSYRLTAEQENLALELILTDEKGPVLQGNQGYSQKGPETGNASHYYSLTRLLSSGTVQVGGRTYQVAGTSWMDHEFSTSALSPGQVGWDWFSIQLEDGHEIMVYQFRQEDGSIDPFSSGTWIMPDGASQHLIREDFVLTTEATWRSPHTGADYPARWTLTVPNQDAKLEIVPYLANQEMNLSYAYWEGAVKVSGMVAGHPVEGIGYVELTGYATSMAGGL